METLTSAHLPGRNLDSKGYREVIDALSTPQSDEVPANYLDDYLAALAATVTRHTTTIQA